MADKKISALTGASTPLAGTEVLPIVQSGATVKVAVSDLTSGRAVSATAVTATTGNFVAGTSSKGVTTGSAVNLGFGTNNSTSQATLFSSGGFSIGDTTDPGIGCLRLSSSTGSATFTIASANTGGADSVIVFALPGANTGYIKYVRSSSQIQVIPGGSGGVSIADGATSWSAISDERQKENLIPIVDAVEKVSSLRAVTGNYIVDATKKSRSFLIAQDVQKVLPEAIDSSNPDILGLAYTDVIPLLVAAVKEQAITIKTMQTALKNANVAGF
jgi:hypothetical protein